MKILLDANTPAPLAHALTRHKVTLAGRLKWQNLEDDALIMAAEEAGFDVLLTCTGILLTNRISPAGNWPL